MSPQYANVGGGRVAQDSTIPSGASTIPQSIKLAAPQLDSARRLSNVTSPAVQANATLGLMYPDFLRKRIMPGKHMVVPGEVDRSLLMESERGRLGLDCLKWRHRCSTQTEE